MTVLKDKAEYELLRASGSVVRAVFEKLEAMLAEGITTAELDLEAERVIRDLGARPAFKGYKGYPATICASRNEAVVHGVPSGDDVVRTGDIISIDVGVEKGGFFADSARSYVMGEAAESVLRIVEVAERCLYAGIDKAVAGGKLGDISAAIQGLAAGSGFEEVRMFVGHGIGRKLHEAPEVPNWGTAGEGPVLEEGLVLAIEPMLNEGTRELVILDDGWTAVTKDGKLSAHFEHTIIVGKERAEIIT